jgi:hypothetical protein
VATTEREWIANCSPFCRHYPDIELPVSTNLRRSRWPVESSTIEEFARRPFQFSEGYR